METRSNKFDDKAWSTYLQNIMKKKYKFNIQKTIIGYFISAVVITSLILVVFSYVVALHLLEGRVKQSFQDTVKYMQGNISRELDEIDRVMNYFFLSSDIKTLISNYPYTEYEQLKNIEAVEHSIREFLVISSLDSIAEIKLFSPKREIFSFNENRGNIINSSSVLKSPEFQNMFSGNPKYFALAKPEFASENFLITLQTIPDRRYREEIGIVGMAINQEVLYRHLESEAFNNIYFCLFDSKGNTLTSRKDLYPTDLLEELKTSREVEYGGNDYLTFPIDNTDWVLAGIVPSIADSNDAMTFLLFCVAAISLAWLFSLRLLMVLQSHILRPVEGVTEGIRNIGKQKFAEVAHTKDEGNEISTLIDSYNHMIRRLQQLIKDNIEEAVSRKEAEYQALQMQINPHFLYNSLNTIRWMAILQKADNIKEYSEKLSNLLRNIARQSGKKCTIRDEIEIVKDFIFIEKLAFGFGFEHEIECEEEDLLESKCISFLLQPIVENAVLHGLPNNREEAFLKITISREGKNLLLSVFDNGDGMQGENLTKMNFSGIALSNIATRLEMEYGSAAGITFKSKENEFTEVIVTLPLEIEK